jgi:hypothetical protein
VIYPYNGDPNVERIHVRFELFDEPIAANDETAFLSLAINRSKSTGAGSCSGCDVPVQLILRSVRVLQNDVCTTPPAARLPDLIFNQTSGSNVARWQSATPIVPSPITIDATALSNSQFQISGGVCLDGAAIQKLNLVAGSYTIGACGGAGTAFSVDAAGLVHYAAALEGQLTGAGTSSLVVHGALITVDLRQAPAGALHIDSDACCPTAQLLSLRVGPWPHVVASCGGSCPALSSIGFGIDNAGHVSYDPVQEGALTGAGSSTLVVKSLTFPPAGDDLAPSMGKFQVVVEPEFWNLMTAPYPGFPSGYPGFALINGVHRLTSPNLFDPATKIGRSAIHRDGDPSDIAGVPVGSAGTIVSDGSFSRVPPGFQGPAGTAEVHTEIRSLNMTMIGGGPVAVRAGIYAPGRPVSPGEIEAVPGITGLFPAESFFNVFVEVDMPFLGTLYNSDPLMVENSGITCFPPQVVYIHRHTGPVPILFKLDDTQFPKRWLAGQRFGWLVLAGHGMNFDTVATAPAKGTRSASQTQADPFAAFDAIVNAEPEMADTATLVVDVHDVLTFSSPTVFTQPQFRDSLMNGMDQAAALGHAGNPCAGLFVATRFYQRVDSLPSPADWVTDPAVRRVLADRFLAMSAQLLAQANQSGGCTGTTDAPPVAPPSRLALLGITPNPSFGMSTIRYAVPKRQQVNLSVFDLGGRLMRTLVDAELAAGTYQAVWDGHQDRAGGRAASSGAYFVRLMSGGLVYTQRVVIVR